MGRYISVYAGEIRVLYIHGSRASVPFAIDDDLSEGYICPQDSELICFKFSQFEPEGEPENFKFSVPRNIKLKAGVTWDYEGVICEVINPRQISDMYGAQDVEVFPVFCNYDDIKAYLYFYSRNLGLLSYAWGRKREDCILCLDVRGLYINSREIGFGAVLKEGLR